MIKQLIWRRIANAQETSFLRAILLQGQTNGVLSSVTLLHGRVDYTLNKNVYNNTEGDTIA